MPSQIDLETSHLEPTPDDELQKVYEKSKKRAGGVFANPYTFWWWLVILIVGWIWVFALMQSEKDYSDAFRQISKGVPLTVSMSIFGYSFALVIGLLLGLIRAYVPEAPDTNKTPLTEFGLAFVAIFHPSTYIPSSNQGFLQRKRIGKLLYVAVYNIITIYVEFMRGIPAIVLLLIAAVIIVPAISDPVEAFLEATWMPFYNVVILPILNGLFNHPINIPVLDWIFHPYEALTIIEWRGFSSQTAILGLGMFYGAFLSEVFRAGIQSVPKGQVEAGKSLGMTNLQIMRYIVIPQAIRNIMPALGNDFIALIKDTSLATILGVNDMTQEAKKWSGSVFTYIPTYAVLSMMYLSITITGSLLVQTIEKRLRSGNVQQTLPRWERFKIWLFGR